MRKILIICMIMTGSSSGFASEVEREYDSIELNSMMKQILDFANRGKLDEMKPHFAEKFEVIDLFGNHHEKIDSLRELFEDRLHVSILEFSADMVDFAYVSDEQSAVWASGSGNVRFNWRYGGSRAEMPFSWTCTLTKEDGSWKIARLHTSADFSNNPVTDRLESYNSVLLEAKLIFWATVTVGVIYFMQPYLPSLESAKKHV